MTDAQIADLLTRAIQHLNQNQAGQAESVLQPLLAAHPAQPQALTLMGIARLMQDRAPDAEALFLRALAQSPGQPMVLFHLGSALRAQGKISDAITVYRQALRATPQHVETQLALGAALREQGDLAGAETLYRALLRQAPGSGAALVGLGATLNALERQPETEALLGDAAAAQPRAELENTLGEAKLQQHRAADAMVHFDRALAEAPTYLPAKKNRVTALELLQDRHAAIAAYRQILAQTPLDLKTHTLLNELLHRSGDTENFLRSYDEAAKQTADPSFLIGAKADQLLKIGRAAEAHQAFEAALAAAPQDVTARIGVGRSLTALGENESAIAAFEAGLKQHPDNADLKTAFAYCLLANAESRRAQTLAQSAVAAAPYSQSALSVLGLCYRANQDGRDENLNGFERFVQVFDLEPPEGYADMASFSAALERHVDGLHQGTREFFSQTLRGGSRSFEDFFAYRHDLRLALRGRIIQALTSYIGALPEAADHPFAGRRTRQSGFSGSWSSRMAEGGFHVNHIHSGWISSVYYVAVPDAVSDIKTKEGWLKFGEPSSDIGLKNPVRRTVQPKPGRLVLFPSYMWHGTIPYSTPGSRTTIAFDVVPR